MLEWIQFQSQCIEIHVYIEYTSTLLINIYIDLERGKNCTRQEKDEGSKKTFSPTVRSPVMVDNLYLCNEMWSEQVCSCFIIQKKRR